jgi:hypothetical protein
MTSPAKEIADYLDTQITGLTSGVNLFVGSEPNTPASVVTVYDSGGFAPDQTMDGSYFINRPTVQVRVCDASYTTGRAQAETIRDTLRQVVRQTLGSDYYGIFLISDIVHLGKITTNAGLAHVWTLNFQLIKED